MTPSTTHSEPGDVVLLRFPFTDLASTKKRPALVVSPARFTESRGDIVVLALTSRPQRDDALRLADWQAVGLPKPTWIKPLIATLNAGLVVRRIGGLAEGDLPRVSVALRTLVADRFRGQR
ncbi:MAG: type II toxin-antitoxin system PemK/MazF family toxin [Planctomycetota bacterium]